MLAEQTRSGLSETYHDGAFAAVDANLELVAWSGDIDRPFYLRSSAKPFQAWVAQEAGAGLTPLEMALACSSHDGLPAHISIVESILSTAGLDQDDLRCPKSWPLSRSGRDLLVADGHRYPRRLWHDCSGKHAGWLRACAARGWDLETYLEPDHPLQVRIREVVSAAGGFDVDPVGVDGCGAPVLRTNVRAMATMYSRLGTEERFASVFDAMHAYPALVSGVGNGDALLATALNVVAKRGARGCLGSAAKAQVGMAAKSWDGSDLVAAQTVAHGIGILMPPPRTALGALQPILNPPIVGGGEQVGTLESRLELEYP